ncbi:MAG: DUF4097 family beta strand repeat-containing protein [Eubacteriales bacterium]|nr:DUF4097 family beta strand repeat-containing protein [Eubacteriales bacterium]
MGKEEYLRRLLVEISDFTEDEREQIKEYFEEMICDRMENGESEAEILSGLGTPEEAGKRLRSEYEARLVGSPQRSKAAQGSFGKEAQSEFEAASASKGDGVGTESKFEESSQEEQKEVFPAFIKIQAENTRIMVQRVKKGNVKVLFRPRENVDDVWTSEEGGGYTFVQRMKSFWCFGFWRMADRWITVQIPEDFDGRLELITKNASIQAENLEHLESLLAETSNAKIILSRITADRIQIKTSNSSVSADEIRGRDFRGKDSNGRIVLERAEFSGTVEVVTSNAPVEVTGLSGSSISLQTSNGAVRGWLTGSMADYNIESKTSNGSNTLPTSMRTGRRKNLKVRTSNGRINLSFAQDC